MDIATASPAEIDTALAGLHSERADLMFKIRREQDGLGRAEAAVAGRGSYRYLTQDDVDSYAARIGALDVKFADVEARIDPLDAEWVARGRWTRAFLVTNTGGHVHSTMECDTCFDTTEFAWLTQFSDHDESEIVGEAGEKACTRCYPTAPIDVLRRKSTIEAPGRREAREAREAAKIERDAKKAAKAITATDGSALRVGRGQYPETLNTLAAAKMWLTDGCAWGFGQHAWYTIEDGNAVAQAVAAKIGTTAEIEMAAAIKRAAKRR